MRSTTKKLLAISASVSLGLAACSSDTEVVTPPVSGEVTNAQETTTTTAPPVVVSVDDESSTLRATLASLLQEHAYLTGLALENVLDGGADDAAAQAALDALEQNTTAIGEAVAGIPGVDDADAFLELWRDHIGYFVDYTVARSEGDQQAAEDALAELTEYASATAELLQEATEGELSAEDLTGELQTHVDSVVAVVDALAGEGEADADPLQLLRDSAAHMEAVAATLAGGIVSAYPDEFPGDPASVPATTRADLTAGVQEQAYLALLVADQLTEAGGDVTDETVSSAITLLEGATEGLATTVGAATGVQERETFLDAWRPLVDALTSYAEARAGGDDAAAEAARAELDAAVGQATTALSELAGGADLGGLLQRNVELITTGFDSITAGDGLDPSVATDLARGARDLGLELASGLVVVSDQEDPPALPEGPDGEDPDGGDGFGSAPDEAAEGTSGAGTVDGAAPGAGTDQTGPGLEEPEEPPSDPSEAGGPSPDGER